MSQAKATTKVRVKVASFLSTGSKRTAAKFSLQDATNLAHWLDIGMLKLVKSTGSKGNPWFMVPKYNFKKMQSLLLQLQKVI